MGGGFKELLVWQKAIAMVVLVYGVVEKYPKHELYGLMSQTRRAAVSIPANIAEGQRRNTKKDFAHFLSIAHGSGAELSTHLIIAEKLGYITKQEVATLEISIDEVMKMTYGMIRSLQEK